MINNYHQFKNVYRKQILMISLLLIKQYNNLLNNRRIFQSILAHFIG
jgi:hypothetical protein